MIYESQRGIRRGSSWFNVTTYFASYLTDWVFVVRQVPDPICWGVKWHPSIRSTSCAARHGARSADRCLDPTKKGSTEKKWLNHEEKYRSNAIYLPKSILHWCYTKLMQIGDFFSHVTETMKTIETRMRYFFTWVTTKDVSHRIHVCYIW